MHLISGHTRHTVLYVYQYFYFENPPSLISTWCVLSLLQNFVKY